MSTLQKQLAEIASYPSDAYVSSRRMAFLISQVLERCTNKQQITLFAGKDDLYMRGGIKLQDDECLFLMRYSRRLDKSRKLKTKRWTFCWQGSGISLQKTTQSFASPVPEASELIVPQLECSRMQEKKKEVAIGSVLQVIKQFSIKQKKDRYLINNGIRTKLLKEGASITANFAIAIARVSGKHTQLASHPDFCRHCCREVLTMSRFKVTFYLKGNKIQTKITLG